MVNFPGMLIMLRMSVKSTMLDMHVISDNASYADEVY